MVLLAVLVCVAQQANLDGDALSAGDGMVKGLEVRNDVRGHARTQARRTLPRY